MMKTAVVRISNFIRTAAVFFLIIGKYSLSQEIALFQPFSRTVYVWKMIYSKRQKPCAATVWRYGLRR
ncbi:DUF2061 domain-containing protein [Paenibacillus sp. NEAU-GSW1]|nr:DUF2061 domain-containing protein [Paenibacillus sp. NEAU-GSW1]